MKARNYREVKGQPYSRKEFIKGAPIPKITKFTMGDTKTKFQCRVQLIALKEAQVRHNALESARVEVNRVLMNKLGNSYCLRIQPYPHVVLRENKMIFGAHADRLSDGMRQSFGKPTGSAARIKPDQTIITVDVNENAIEIAKEALNRGENKLPIPCQIKIEKIAD